MTLARVTTKSCSERRPGSGSFDRERQHLIDATCAGREHQHAIEADRDASALGKAGFERAQQKLVHLFRGEAAAAAYSKIVFEAGTLLVRGRELVEAVG